MKILFLTIGRLDNIEERGIYTDLLREFRNNEHEVYVVTPREKRENLPTELSFEYGVTFLRIKTGNITKTNTVEKGISTILIDYLFKAAIKKFFSDIKFDLILYSTPPITLSGLIAWIKNRDGARSYLLLKDIFPQNAVDLNILSKKGLSSLAYRYFRKTEKKLYALSDFIGCMSQANVDYILNHNPEIPKEKVEVCPNSIEPYGYINNYNQRNALREKYNLPTNKVVFVYGGNVGRPQGVDFIIDCLDKCKNIQHSHFIIVGSGTEFHKLCQYVETHKPMNVTLMNPLKKPEYDELLSACDVGLIFLDYRFTIPNFPSRMLDYMNCRLPILAATDNNTDIGEVIVSGNFGWWCESNDDDAFRRTVEIACKANRDCMGEKAWENLISNYTVERGFQIVMNSINV